MCLLLVGVTLRMAPIIDDMGKSISIHCFVVVFLFRLVLFILNRSSINRLILLKSCEETNTVENS